MDILQQCQIWSEQNKQELIIKLIESLPEEQRTALVDSELAQAYNYLADISPIQAKDILYLKKAVALLKKHEAELGDTFEWNFRLGYAYFYLEQHDLSIKYMQKALLLNANGLNDSIDKEAIEYYLDYCEKTMEMPESILSFLDRVDLAWGEFKQRRSQIEDLINNNEHDKAIALLDDCFHVLFDEINFELSIKGKVYEVIFPTECDLATILQLKTFIAHAPRKVKKHWSFIIGRPADANLIIDNGTATLTSQDITVYSCDLGNNRYDLKIIAPKIKKFVSTDEQAQKLAFYFISNTLGEVNYLNHLASLELLNKDANINDLSGYDQGCTLDSFILKLKEQGLKLNNDVKSLPDSCFNNFQLARQSKREICSRLDIDHGISCLLGLHYEYIAGDSTLYNSFYHNGAVPLFICFEQTNQHQSSSLHISDSQLAQMVATIRNKTSAVATIVGYAAGLHYGYIDCIAWDFLKFITIINNFLEKTDNLIRVAFQVFSHTVNFIQLKPLEDVNEVKISLDTTKELLAKQDFAQLYEMLVQEPLEKNNFEADFKILNSCSYAIGNIDSNSTLKTSFINHAEIILNYYKDSESNNPLWLCHYGVIAYEKGELEVAVNALDKLLSIAPNYPGARNVYNAYKIDYNIELQKQQAKGFSEDELLDYHTFRAIVFLKKPIKDIKKFNLLFKKQLPDYYTKFSHLPEEAILDRYFNHNLCYLSIFNEDTEFEFDSEDFEGNNEKQNIVRKYQSSIDIECCAAKNRSVAETSIFFNRFIEALFELDEVLGVYINLDLKTKGDFIIPDGISFKDQYLTAADNIINVSGFTDDDGVRYIGTIGLNSFGFHDVEIYEDEYPQDFKDSLFDCLYILIHLLLSKKIKLIPGKVIPFIEGLSIIAKPSINNFGSDCWNITFPEIKALRSKRSHKRR